MRFTGGLSRIVVLLLTPLWIAGCASSGAVESEPPGILHRSPCQTSPAGDANRQGPIVCVDDAQRVLAVRPDPVELHDVLRDDRKAPVALQWFTTSGRGDLQVEVEPGCVSDVRCNGRGHCSARAVAGAGGRTCKYDVWINGGNHDRLDPTIVISPCCT